MSLIVHIAQAPEWAAAKAAGVYAPESLSREGFIHLSRPEDVHWPANAVYSGEHDFVLLWVDPSRLSAEVRFELPGPGAPIDFPHLYGPLDVDAVVGETSLEPWERGSFVLPPQPGD